MTFYQILNLFLIASSNSSLRKWCKEYPEVNYNDLRNFFAKNFNANELVKDVFTILFKITKGWLIIDEVILKKSKEGKLKSCKRRYKSTGGYITPAVSIILLIWTDGKIRIPLKFQLRMEDSGSPSEVAMELLSWFRNRMKYKPECVLFDSGFTNQRLLKRIDDYGWLNVYTLPKSRLFNDIQLRVYKKQGYWNDIGYLSSGLKVKAVRVKAKFYVTNKISLDRSDIIEWFSKRAIIEEVFRVLKQECHWDKCQFSNDNKFERFYSLGVVTFITWEYLRILYFRHMTIYQLRRSVMFNDFKLRIPLLMDFSLTLQT